MVTIFAAAAAIAAASAVTALAVGGAQPPPRPLAGAIHESLAGGAVAGVSADVTFTDNLIASANVGAGPSGLGSGSPLLSGASGRLWISADGRLRLELQAVHGDTEILVSHDTAMLEDVAANTVYEIALPKRSSSDAPQSGPTGATGVPTVSAIQQALTRLMGAVNVSAATPTNVGGAPAYSVTISPKHPAGLLGEAVLAWDAQHAVPLDVAIYATGNSTPVLELRATSVNFGPVQPSVFAISPPPGAHVVQISPQGAAAASSGTGAAHHLVVATGVTAVSAALPFSLDAPASLGGLQRDHVAALDWNGKLSALARYGQGLGSVAVVEFQAGAHNGTGGAGGGLLGSLPHVSLGDVTASELPTALGTVIEFTRGGVDYVVAGFVGPAAVEAVARGL